MNQDALIHAKPFLKKHRVISSHKHFWNRAGFYRIPAIGYPYCSLRWNDHILGIGAATGNAHHSLTDSKSIDFRAHGLNHP